MQRFRDFYGSSYLFILCAPPLCWYYVRINNHIILGCLTNLLSSILSCVYVCLFGRTTGSDPWKIDTRKLCDRDKELDIRTTPPEHDNSLASCFWSIDAVRDRGYRHHLNR